MRPSPFRPVSVEGQPDFFVRDGTTGLVWHKTFSRPLYADTDRAGVVYHANYLRYFELGRATLMRDVGYPYKEVEAQGYMYPIIDLGIQFHYPLRYDEPMWIHTRPESLERIRVRFHYLITHGENGAVVCTGYTYHCALGRDGNPTALDPATVKMWNQFPR